jgi:hypothetical protein
MMIEARWTWVRALGSMCLLGSLAAVACSDSEGNGGTAGDGGSSGSSTGGSSGSGNGGSSGSGNGGTGAGDAGVSECRCGGLLDCPTTLAELCADLPEGCPARLDTWLTCAERGQLVERDDVGELYLEDCDGHRIVQRQANYIGKRSWVYDVQGRLVGAANIDDSGVGPRCGLIVANECRFGSDGDPLVRHDSQDAGGDAGSSADGGAADGGALDGGASDADASAADAGPIECSRL